MKGYIYKLYCLNDNIKECYIGSCWDIKVRMRVHKSSCNNINSSKYNLKVYTFIRTNGNWSNWDYEYYEVEAIDTTDLKMKEQERMDIDINPILNDRRAYTRLTTEEYQKQYRIDNLESIKLKHNKKYNCECGGKYTKQQKARHFKSLKHQTYINQV